MDSRERKKNFDLTSDGSSLRRVGLSAFACAEAANPVSDLDIRDVLGELFLSILVFRGYLGLSSYAGGQGNTLCKSHSLSPPAIQGSVAALFVFV